MELVFKCNLFTVKLFYSNDFIWGFFFLLNKSLISEEFSRNRDLACRETFKGMVYKNKKAIVLSGDTLL